MSANENRPEAAIDAVAASSNSSADVRPAHPTKKLSRFHAARDQIALARDAARDRARAEGRPIRLSEVDELLRGIDDGCALDDGSAVGDD